MPSSTWFEPDVHGVWVRSLIHDGFGRIAYKQVNRLGDGSTEYLVMWEPDEALDPRRHTASIHDAKDLVVRPYKPKPWLKPAIKEVTYE